MAHIDFSAMQILTDPDHLSGLSELDKLPSRAEKSQQTRKGTGQRVSPRRDL